MTRPDREAAIAAAVNALSAALVTDAGPDETVDRHQLTDLLSGRLDLDAERALFDGLGLDGEVRQLLAGLRNSKDDREIARRAIRPDTANPRAMGLESLGMALPATYQLDGPHGASGPTQHGEATFRRGDHFELLARPARPVESPPPIALWASQRGHPLHEVDAVTVQRDASGVYRLIAPADALFVRPGRWCLTVVLGEQMTPERAEQTESLVQLLRAWAHYAP